MVMELLFLSITRRHDLLTEIIQEVILQVTKRSEAIRGVDCILDWQYMRGCDEKTWGLIRLLTSTSTSTSTVIIMPY